MSREAMKLALEALDNLMYWDNGKSDYDQARQAITALETELAKPDFWEGYVPEPVKPEVCCGEYATCLRACTPRGKWLAQQALDKKAENARELGLDYEPAQQGPVAYLCENAVGHKYFRWKKPSSTYKPIALYTTSQRTWQGLTDEERKLVRNSVGYNQFVTAGEYAEHVQKATEFKLLEKNT